MNGAKRPADRLVEKNPATGSIFPDRPGIKKKADQVAPAADGRLAQNTRIEALRGQIAAANHLKTAPVTRSFGH